MSRKFLPIRHGIFIGLVVSLALSFLRDSPAAVIPLDETKNFGAVLPDAGGAIQEIVIHYVPAAGDTVARTYRDFLSQLSADTTVYVICADRAAVADLRRRVGKTACRWVPVLVDHPITTWSRDRWLALAPLRSDDIAAILSPAGEDGEQVWAARAGDAKTGRDLARFMPKRLRAIRSRLYFDGGDFVVDETTAFVIPRVIERNVGRTVKDLPALRRHLANTLKRKIVFLKHAPPHHAGMFMMPIGRRTILVGDPSAAKKLAVQVAAPEARNSQTAEALLAPLLQADFSAHTQAQFDAVAKTCAALGYTVVRLPVVPGRDSRTYLTSLNVILDRRGGERVVYMPVYVGAEWLNQAAESIWQAQGYTVRRVDCTATYRHFGSLRCLVNILRRTHDR